MKNDNQQTYDKKRSTSITHLNIVLLGGAAPPIYDITNPF